MGNIRSEGNHEIGEVAKNNFQDLKKILDHFSTHYPDGKIRKTEFVRENLELKGGKAELWERLFDFIANQSDSICYQEFVVFLSSINPNNGIKDTLETTFRLLDIDKNGYLDKRELGVIANVIAKTKNAKAKKHYHEDHPVLSVEDYKKKFLTLMDTNGDGRISKKEFTEACLKDAAIRELFYIPLNQVTLCEQNCSFRKLHANTFDSQVGGHGSTNKNVIKKTIIQVKDKIMKPLCKREFGFYEKLFSSQKKDDVRMMLKGFIPDYYGHQYIEYSDIDELDEQPFESPNENIVSTEKSLKTSKMKLKEKSENKEKSKHSRRRSTSSSSSSNSNDNSSSSGKGLKKSKSLKKLHSLALRRKEKKNSMHYIVLKNLTYGMKYPCCLDLKMGSRGFDRHAGIKKRIQQIFLCAASTSNRLGFRVCGMKVWKPIRKNFFKINKYQGCALLSNQIEDTLISFINNGQKIRVKLLLSAIPQLQKILKFFSTQKKYHFYSSSILLMYDGDPNSENPKMLVKMIDFSHVDKAKTVDQGYKKGLINLIKIFEHIISKYK